MQRRTDSDARRVDGENADCSEARLRGVRRHIGCSRPERLEVANVLVPIQQIVTFATDPFRGNPAFVLMPSSPLPAPILQQLCSHLHEPMIAVVTPKDGGFHLSCVMPTGFHPGAGHATHAAAWVVLKTLRPDDTDIKLHLDSGKQRPIRTEGDLISVDWPAMPCSSADLLAPLRDALGAQPLATHDSAFGAIAVFDSEEAVADLAPDMQKISELSAETVMVTSPARNADFTIRVFAPKAGLPEDPVCGTAHRILTPLWAAKTGRRALVSHQLSERGGELFCRLHDDVVTISGRATLFLTGSVDLPLPA
jgi:PhzF family phenazine biosynthesis protein